LGTLTTLEKALTKAGVEFIPADQKGEGVKRKDPEGVTQYPPIGSARAWLLLG
jgi:hypothetical protein